MTLPAGLDDFRASGAAAEPEAGPASAPVAAVPHVVAWNLTQRCNLACAHCYIAAGPWHGAGDELTTDECRRITDEILEVNPSPMFVLSGGEPLVRDDLEAIAAHASGAGATVVVGTNGIGLTEERIASLQEAGVQGVAISVDSLAERYHDRFRHGAGALADTLAAVERLRKARLDFVVQTTLTRGNRDEVRRVAAWAADAGAVCFNLYFLVETGRGSGMRGLPPEENEEVLRDLVELQREYRGRMMVRSKCQPAIMRLVHEEARQAGGDSPLLHYATRCPCGLQYCRITPEGKVTPCPYNPAVAGDLRERPFGRIWREAELFRTIRGGELGGRCGKCEYRVVCGGCRARAYATAGDVLAEDPACAYQPSGDAEPILPSPEATYGATPAESELDWTPEARARIERIPSFVRGVVSKRVEDYARREGLVEVTPELLDRIRRDMPVDFSKRLPFFARRDQDP